MARDLLRCALADPPRRTGVRRRPVLSMLVGLLGCNAVVWSLAMSQGQRDPLFLGACALAYGFGLRHAFDADHIASIDNVTRMLAKDAGAPPTVGLWFALGHSTVVMAACAAIALMIRQPHAWLPRLAAWGTLGGSVFSVLFLGAAAGINALSLPALVGAWRRGHHASAWRPGPRGLRAGAVGAVMRRVTRPWHMLLVGLLFGLGFDTASEVGLLGLSVGAAPYLPSRASIMVLLVLPALFTAGMSLADGTDGAIMARAYGWALERPRRRVTYNLLVTSLSILAALMVAAAELGNLARQQYLLRGEVWRLVAWTGVHSDLVGTLICTTLLACWAVVVRGRSPPCPARRLAMPVGSGTALVDAHGNEDPESRADPTGAGSRPCDLRAELGTQADSKGRRHECA